jgi:hypothetical protein
MIQPLKIKKRPLRLNGINLFNPSMEQKGEINIVYSLIPPIFYLARDRDSGTLSMIK